MDCKTCGTSVATFPDLLQHIISNPHRHPKWQLKWASEKICNSDFLDQKASRQEQFKQMSGGKLPLTEQEQQNKVDASRPLSGETQRTLALCICGKNHYEEIPVEHIESPFAWRKGTKLILNCETCNSKSKRYF